MQELSKIKKQWTQRRISSSEQRSRGEENSPNGCHFTVIEIQGTDKHHQPTQSIHFRDSDDDIQC